MKSEFVFEGWHLSFNSDMEYAPYEDKTGYGIQFIIDGIKYDLFHNRVGLSRIFISQGIGWLKDIPFHAGTIGLLPNCIKFERQ